MRHNTKHQFKDFLQPIFMFLLFWLIAIYLWLSTNYLFYLFNFGYIGTALGLGISIYELLPGNKKGWGRRLAQFLVGAYMLGFLGLFQHENMQIEGFFLYLLSGLFAGSVIHYLIAKVFGPIVFNRGWCGWACWTAMILDLLPYKINKNKRLKGWGIFRYIHFFFSLALIFVLWFVFGYRLRTQSHAELFWLTIGNVLYYLIAFILAFYLKDNRAFCKYVCPIPAIQKLTSRFSLLKISTNKDRCIQCGVCDHVCPMDIHISVYAAEGKRISSSECIFCLECVNACPHDALASNLAFDCGSDLIIYRE